MRISRSAGAMSVVIGSVDEVPLGEGRTFAVGEQQIVVYRLRDGTLRALDAVCPHKGGPLADGLIDNDVVVCPLHGRTYDLNTGAETTGSGQSVCAHAVSADDDGSLRLNLEGD